MDSRLRFDRLIDRVALPLFGASLALILTVTLYPYQFTFPASFGADDLRQTALHVVFGISTPGDVFNNLLLFIPFGFAGGCLGHKHRVAGLAAWVAIVSGGALLALAIELLQLGLPGRTTALIDVATNTLSTLLGLFCFVVVRSWAGSARRFAAGLAAYLVLVLLASLPIQRATWPTNWDESYPILFGNERGGGRPWDGTIRRMALLDRALDQDEVVYLVKTGDLGPFAANRVVDYRFDSNEPYRDQAEHVPDLAWRGRTSGYTPDSAGISVGSGAWLRTPGSVPAAARLIAPNGQVTLAIQVKPATSDVRGPGRIVTISDGTRAINLMVGQDRRHLVVRLRTPVTGVTAGPPELVVPNSLASGREQSIIVTYDRFVLRVYLDGQQHPAMLRLSPEALLLKYLLPSNVYERSMLDQPVLLSKGLYYTLVFLPLGAFLGWIVPLRWVSVLSRVARYWWGRALVAAIAALAVESALALAGGRGFWWENLLLSVLIGGVALEYFLRRARRFVDPRTGTA